MDLKEARSYLNYLLTLNIRGEEAFGPMALAFIKDNDLGGIGLEPEEQFGLSMATVASLADEPKRFSLKLEMLQKTKALLFSRPYPSKRGPRPAAISFLIPSTLARMFH